MLSLRLTNQLRPYLTTSAIYINRLQHLHQTRPNQAVKYVRNENVYFKKIYSDDLQFQRLEPLIKNKKIVEDENLSSFNNMVNASELSNSDLMPFFQNFTSNLKDNKDVDSLIFVLNRLRESKFKSFNQAIRQLITFIDENLEDYLEKERVITNEKFEMLFQIALLFDEIGIQKWSKFICRLSSKTLENVNLIENKENLLRLCYIMNLNRLQIDDHQAILIELQAVKFLYLNELNLRELGLICLSFHKTKTKFQTKLIEQIVEKLIQEFDQVEDTLCINSILKGIYSTDYVLDAQLLDRLLDKILNKKPSDDDFFILYKFLSIKKKYKSYNEALIKKNLESFLKQDSMRIKDLSRLILNLLYFDVELNAKQIGKFNELFEHQKSHYALYRHEYFLCTYALAAYGLIRKDEIYNIYQPRFLNLLRTKYSDTIFNFLSLNNILKLYGDTNYRNIALKGEELQAFLKNFESVSAKEIYARFKKFDNYSSKVYLTYQALKEKLNNRVNLVHVLPGTKYPVIVITPQAKCLKDYQFEITSYSVLDTYIVKILSHEFMCDKTKERVNGFYKLEDDLLKQMGFKIIQLTNSQISHKANELNEYLDKVVFSQLDE